MKLKKIKYQNIKKTTVKEKIYAFLFIIFFFLILLVLIPFIESNDSMFLLLIISYFIIIIIGSYFIFKKDKIFKVKYKDKINKELSDVIVGFFIGLALLPLVFYYNPYIVENVGLALLVVIIFTIIPSLIGYIIGINVRK